MRKTDGSKGFVLVGSMMMVLISSMIAGSLVVAARRSHPGVLRWEQHDQSLLAAQTALEKIKSDLYRDFADYHEQSGSWNDLNWLVNNAGSYGVNDQPLSGVLGSGVQYPYGDARVRVEVQAGSVVAGSGPDERHLYVTITVRSAIGGISRQIEEVIRYQLQRSSVFNYAYFVNNFGWFHGVDMVVNGPIRSNRDIDLNATGLIPNGPIDAHGVFTRTRVGSPWSWNTYAGNSYRDSFRPALHVDHNRRNAASYFEWGYDSSTAARNSRQAELPMPYIGNISDYVYLAQSKGGTIQQGGGTLVDAVFNGTGPSGNPDASDKGTLVLVGTVANPIVLDGPVVVEGDVIIKGYFTGQGTIYAGRNVHVIGDLVAVDPPRWTHPDTAANFTNNTLPDNLERDFLGLCAKGAVVIGDYTLAQFRNTLEPYSRPPFTAEYQVSYTDHDIGYVTHTTADGKHMFNGDYTATFGTKSDGSARKYYESSLPDAQVRALGPTATVGRLDAVIYNNHMTMGRFANNAVINGGIICRDEALWVSGRTYLNWDPRLAMVDRFRPYLPMRLDPASTIRWREMDVSL